MSHHHRPPPCDCKNIRELEKKLYELEQQTYGLSRIETEDQKKYESDLLSIDKKRRKIEDCKKHCFDLVQKNAQQAYLKILNKQQAIRQREKEVEQRKEEEERKRMEEEQLERLAEQLGREEKQRELEARQREELRKEEIDTFDDTKLAKILKIEEERERNNASFIDNVGSAFTKVGQAGVSLMRGIENGLSSLWKGGSRSSLRNRRQKKRISKKRNFRRKM
jgi:DNA repair exonuclease SbcCD ATPase subunit